MISAKIQLLSWLTQAMLAWVPVTPTATADELAAEEFRYERIAHDAMEVSMRDTEEAIYPGTTGRAKSALLLLSIALWESRYMERIDSGHCLPKECDGGAAFGLLQVHAGRGLVLDGLKIRQANYDDYRLFSEGKIVLWQGKDLIADRQKLFTAGLRMARSSIRWCGNLASYASGHCGAGKEKALVREKTAVDHWRAHPAPVTDEEVRRVDTEDETFLD